MPGSLPLQSSRPTLSWQGIHRWVLLLYTRLKAVLSRCEDAAKDQSTRDHLTWTAGERGSHALSVYPTQCTSRMGTARVKEEKEADTRIIVIE